MTLGVKKWLRNLDLVVETKDGKCWENIGKCSENTNIFTFLSEKGHFEEPGGDFFSCDVWQLAASMHCRATASPGGEFCGEKPE